MASLGLLDEGNTMTNTTKKPKSRVDWHLSNLVYEGSRSRRYVGRDAKTGRFITVKEAKRRPGTTTVEPAKLTKTGK